MSERAYDVILWGATGFTGRLVAEYLVDNYGDKDLSWAMAGRNQEKLLSVQKEIGAEQIPTIIADSLDRTALDAMTQQAKVICTTVGPYAKYGSPLVASCIESGTDYCDLTGEVQWMRKMIDQHHQSAKDKGVRIVHNCGFDSVPSDMGVYFLQNQLLEDHGEYAEHIKMRVKAMKGGMSGGTYASLSYVMEEAAEDQEVFKVLFDPYGLNPKDSPRGQDEPDLQKIIYDKDAKSWIAPFIMAAINTKVVRRSHALSGHQYGTSFKYDEAMLTGDGVVGKMKGYAIGAALGLLMAGKPGSMLKKLTDKVLPDPGEGPNKSQRDNGFYNLHFYGKMRDGSIHVAKVKGDRDPGYGSTSKMLAEAAICLAKDKEDCPSVSGILSPAVALAGPYLKRLSDNAGLTFERVLD